MQEATPHRHLAPGDLKRVRYLDLPSHRDSRGVLTAIESTRDIPFEIRRVYTLHDIDDDRGGHAHRDTHQLIIAVAGSFEVELSDGSSTRAYPLGDPAQGLLLGPMLFIRLTHFAAGTVGLVLASTHYDKSRSIRSWEEYLEVIGR